jgi:transposase
MELERRYQVQLIINSGITETNVIAKLTGQYPRTIRGIKKRLKERGTIERKAGSGRPR